MESISTTSTLAGRVASFDNPVQVSKRRASSTKKKQPTTVSWPHKTPTPLQLARAGFFYKPSASNIDSVTCFLCDKALDGWEPDDNPNLEHIAHVPDCGWAINACIEMRSQDPDRVEEDPQSARMTDARKMTFGSRWPHEGKKGWKCKIDKMVDAGWSYDPLPEADDCVKCFYCGVCLDGWEPKDDPWYEHQRRSPECHFFTLIEDAKKTSMTAKNTKGRVSRMSKVNRLSTQSAMSSALESQSADLQDNMASEGDDTILTTASRNSVVGKGAKKTSKKTGVPKAKRKGVKKLSNMPADDEQRFLPPSSEPAAVEPVDISVANQPVAKPRGRRTTKRVASQVVNQFETGAAVEAVHDTSQDTSPPRKAPRTRFQKKDAEASVDLSQVYTDHGDETMLSRASGPIPRAQRKKKVDEDFGKFDNSVVIVDAPPMPPAASRMTRGKKRTSDGKEKIESSFISAHGSNQPLDMPSRMESDQAPSIQKKVQNNQKPLPQLPTTEAVQNTNVASPTPPGSQARNPVVAGTEDTEIPTTTLPSTVEEVEDIRANQGGVSPMADQTCEPSSSQQSSDAENQPPSSRPSLMAPLAAKEKKQGSPMAEQTATPAASPSRGNTFRGALQSSAPWNPADLETILLASPSTRQNHNAMATNSMETALQSLTSAEKKMSVQEWILWNAQHAEERLRGECERMINVFESEGVRALRTLEGIECA